MTWKVDYAHSHVQFSAKHMMISTVRGSFDKYTVDANINEEDPTQSDLEVKIETASVNTRNEQRDAHLRSADFFNAEEYPEITFEAKHVEAIDDESSHLVGSLTMHGVTRDVKLTAVVQGTDVDPWGNERAGLEIVGVLKRSDFDMKFNQALGSGNVLVGDSVKLSLDLSAIKSANDGHTA